jgi:hypothetical protein
MQHKLRTVVAAVAILVAACGDDDSTDTADTEGSATGFDVAAAREHCEASGGEVQGRHAYWNTNGDPENWLDLGATIEVFRFQTLDDEAESRIYVDLRTLYSETPTLAGIAYLSKVPVALPEQPSANPATFNCASLGGTSQFGNTATVGGWVNEDDPIDTSVALCVFADESFIDEFGIFYYADDTVRGIDLATVMRYQPRRLPGVFR